MAIDKSIFEKICKDGEEYLSEFENAMKTPRESQIAFLRELLKFNENTEYGKKYDFEGINSFEDFKKKVPVTEYADYQNYIDRMIDNDEQNLICADPVTYYATSSGSTGKPKRIPNTYKNVDAFSTYGGNVLFAYLNRELKKQGKEPGPVCILADLSWSTLKEGITIGSISSHLTTGFMDDANKLVTSPVILQRPKESIQDAVYLKALYALAAPDLCMIYGTFSSAIYEFVHLIETHWKSLVDTIRVGKISADMELPKEVRAELSKALVPNPERADFLEKEFSKGFGDNIMLRIWPNLALISCVGGSFFAEYTRRLRAYCGDTPIFMNGYGSSESIMGIPLELNVAEYTLLINRVFFEFLEVGKEDFSETVLIDELEEGKNYEIIISNMSGFYRYRMLDVIHIEGIRDNNPYGHIVYRLNQVISMVGEKTNTEQLEYVVKEFSKKLGVSILEYSLFPDYSTSPARYILFMEPEKLIGKGDQLQYTETVDELFRKVNVSFEKYRHQETLDAPLVIFVEPSTYMLYKELQIAHGTSPNQVKPVRVIDSEGKIKFFFGLSEGPFRTMQRVIFEMKRQIERVSELEAEVARLKEQIKTLEKDSEDKGN